MKKIFLIVISVLVFLFAILEISFRAVGFKPYDLKTRSWKLTPHYFLTADSVLGYKLDTGVYHFEIGDKVFTATHNAAHERITSFNDTASNDNRQRIFFMGGHNIYGFGVNDEQTLPFIFQNEFPFLKVRNLGVLNYGVATDYVIIHHLADVRKGDVFVLMYFYDHDKRPSLRAQKGSYSYVQAGDAKEFPSIALDENLQPYFKQDDYKPFPFNQYSAFVNFLEDKYILYSDTRSREHEIARKAIVALDRYCKARGATLVVVGRRKDAVTAATIDYWKQNGVHAARILLSDVRMDEKNDKTQEKKNFSAALMNYFQKQKIIDTVSATRYQSVSTP